MRTSGPTSRFLLFVMLFGLVVAYFPGQLTSLTQWKGWRGSGSNQEEPEKKKEKDFPKLEGKEECFNYRTPGKKINCRCSHVCDLDKGDPNNRYIVPGAEDYKCSNHCRKDKCKCKTKCQT